MAQISANRGNPQASDVAVQNSLPHVGSLPREDGQTVFNLIDAQLAKAYEDRNVLLTGGVISYNALGDTLTFSNDVNLELNSRVAGGAPLVITVISATETKTVSTDGKMIYAVVDRVAGTAVLVDDSATLPAQDSTNLEVFLIAKRRDEGSTAKVYFRNGFVIKANQTASFGSTDDFSDATFSVTDATDNTIKFKVDVAGTTNTSTTLLTSQTSDKVLTLPDITDTLITRTTSDTAANRLQNKDLDDSTTYFVDTTNTTKKLKFDVAGSTNVTTTIESASTAPRTITLPDRTDTLVTLSGDEILTNKTLSSGTIIDTDQPAVISTNSTSSALKITQSGLGNALVVEDETLDSTPFVIDSNGNVIIGTSTALTGYGFTPKTQIVGSTTGNSSILLQSTDRSTAFPTAVFANAASSNSGLVSSGDILGQLSFFGGDGVAPIKAATISSEVDGAPSLNDMPGRLVFSTTADGASIPTERLRIDSAGNINAKTDQGATIPLLKGVEIEDVVTVEPSLDLQFTNEAGFPGSVTFSRNSVAKYYDGKTSAKSEENFLINSEDFNSFNWYKQFVSVTSNSTVAPNQTATADTVTGLSGTNFKRIYQTYTSDPSGFSGTYTFSVFAKANTHNFVQLLFNGSGNTYANFNISTGTVGNSSVGATASIINVGSGWYRCSLTSTLVSDDSALIALVDSNTSARAATSSTTNSVYLWGAQLEQRDTLTDYVYTNTSITRKFTPVLLEASANTPRIDYDPITSQVKGLLMEKASTNLALHSEDFSNVAWTKTRSSIYSNYVVAPDGTKTADKLIEDGTASNTHFITQNINLDGSSYYTISAYVKAAERTQTTLSVFTTGGFSVNSSVVLDLTSGATIVTGFDATGGAIPVGNGWYRIYLTQMTNGVTGSKSFNIFTTVGSNTTYSGNNYSGIYIWGAQVEKKRYMSSYMKTTSTSFARSSDSAVMSGSSFTDWYKQDEGTFYIEAGTKNNVLTDTISEVIKITGPNLEEIYVARAFFSLETEVGIKFLGSGQAYLNDLPNNIEAFKIAFAYSSDNFASSTDGKILITDTSGVVPVVNTFYLGGTTLFEQVLDGHIKRIIYWPERIDDVTIQTITALS